VTDRKEGGTFIEERKEIIPPKNQKKGWDGRGGVGQKRTSLNEERFLTGKRGKKFDPPSQKNTRGKIQEQGGLDRSTKRGDRSREVKGEN